MWQMVFTHISIEGWIIDPYVQSLFYCSHLVQVLSPNNVEIVDGNIVNTNVAVGIYGRGGFQMFLEPFSKSSWGLSNIFLITINPVTLISVDDSTLPLDWIFVLGSHQEVLDGGVSFTIHLYPKHSWCSHWVHYSMVPLCKTSSGYCYWFCSLELVFCLVSLFSSEFYWEPK